MRTSIWAASAFACAWAGPAFAGPPFLTDDPATTPESTYEILLFAAGSHASDGDSGDYGIDFNYGSGADLQLTMAVPMSYERPDGGPDTSALGTIELAAKVRVLHQASFGWDVAVFPRLFVPSDTELSQGRVSLLLPIWIGREWDEWSTFGGGGCAISRGGEAQDYCLAGWALTRQVLPNLQVGGEVFHESADTTGGKAATTLGLGVTYDINENLHLLGWAGAGLQNTDETGDGSWYSSVLFTF